MDIAAKNEAAERAAREAWDARRVACPSCGWEGTIGETDDDAYAEQLKEYAYHMEPGDEWPAGECPTGCGASVFLVKTGDDWTLTGAELPPAETSVQGWWEGGEQAVAFYDPERDRESDGWFVAVSVPLSGETVLVEAIKPPRYWKLLDDPKAEIAAVPAPPAPEPAAEGAPTWIVPVTFVERDWYRGAVTVRAGSADDAKRRVEAGEYEDMDVGKNLGGDGIEELTVDGEREIERVDG